jgi:hypothetical protein
MCLWCLPANGPGATSEEWNRKVCKMMRFRFVLFPPYLFIKELEFTVRHARAWMLGHGNIQAYRVAIIVDLSFIGRQSFPKAHKGRGRKKALLQRWITWASQERVLEEVVGQQMLWAVPSYSFAAEIHLLGV